MRSMVFGANGQLGRDLTAVFRELGETRPCTHADIDIADAPRLHQAVEDFAPDVVLNAAAYTAVDQAESDVEAAFLTNETGARNLAEIADYLSIPVVYFSTDYVFDGKQNRPYRPSDPIAPQGIYAQSKAAGEAATAKTNHRHLIIRTAWLFGPGGGNFVEKILRAAAVHKQLRVIADQTGSPAYTRDLAEAAARLLQTGQWGHYHFVNAGSCTRHAFAEEIIRQAGLDTPVLPCAAAEYPAPAPRPAYSVLDTAGYTAVTGHTPRPWQQALASYIAVRTTHAR